MYSIVEQFTEAKTGKESDNEDRLVITKDFAVVIDGMTPQDTTLYAGESPARICTDLLSDCIHQFSGDETVLEAAEKMTARIRTYYEENGIVEEVRSTPYKRMGANLILYGRKREEIWFIGDCHCLVDGEHHTNEKLVDTLLTEMRSGLIEEHIKTRSVAELMEEDLVAKDLRPFLRQQYLYQNSTAPSPLSYTVIDGFPVLVHQIKVLDVRHAKEIILASDGYPHIERNLADTEETLFNLLKLDPFCFRIIPTTKGLITGNVSFDDRSYIKIEK